MSGIDAVRARLARDLSLRLIHRDTAGDVQALLDHHAKLHDDRDQLEGVEITLRDALAHAGLPTAGIVQVLADRCRRRIMEHRAPAIDLEQFREAVTHYRRDLISDYKGGHMTDNGAAMAEADRLLALIDGQATPGCGACGDGCVTRGSCRVRDESPPCNSGLPTKGEGE